MNQATKSFSVATVLTVITALSFIYTGLLYKNSVFLNFVIYKNKTILDIASDFDILKHKIPFLVLIIYGFITYVLTAMISSVVAAFYADKYDSENPRVMRSSLHSNHPVAARVHAAHLNCIESFPLFIATVIMAHLFEVPLDIRANFSLMFLCFRMLYIGFYYANMSTFRTFIHMCSMNCLFLLMLMAVFGKGFKENYDGMIEDVMYYIKALKFNLKTEL